VDAVCVYSRDSPPSGGKETERPMLSRLTGTKRTTAGRLLALVYLFCVLAPAMSFAFADGARAAACLTEDKHGMGIVHMHESVGAVAQHVHKDSRSHDHSSLAIASASEDGQTAAATDPDSSPLDHHKSSGGQCCGMVCVNALPATMTEVVRPTTPQSICLSTDYRAVADNTPPQRYRPPIA
jgi:hypothetical protein